MTTELKQGSDEWRLARAGSLGASQIKDIIARTKSGWGASRDNVMAQLIAERLTGQPSESYTNAAMAWGVEHEGEARQSYEFYGDCVVLEVGLIKHPKIPGTHASPDGLIDADGLVEIKAPMTSTHIDTLLDGSVPTKYVPQMQWQMACSGRKWCDWVSYDPRLPESMRLFVRRVPRDDVIIAALEKDVTEFLAELDGKVAALTAKYATVSQAAE